MQVIQVGQRKQQLATAVIQGSYVIHNHVPPSLSLSLSSSPLHLATIEITARREIDHAPAAQPVSFKVIVHR